MERRFDLLVFDWDGTLVDSTGSIVHAIRSTCADLALPVPSRETASHVIGLGFKDAIAHVVPGLEEARFGEFTDRYRYHFLANEQAISLFPGVEEGLAELDDMGFMLAVATGKSRAGLNRALGSLNVARRFVATRCADEGFPKPHPDMLLWLMSKLGVERERTLMIGDTTHDLEMAANAGTPAVAVGCGAHPRESLEAHDALACLDTTRELMQWLRENG